jgi:hypothetical protein
MARKPDRLTENFGRALEEVSLCTTLGQWMAAHRAELEALFREGEPDWAKMAAEFGRAGLRDETGQKPTPGTAENTWRVVKAAASTAQKSRVAGAVRKVRTTGR